MSQPLVSILVVTHNAEKYIEATVASCLRQTHQNIELLVLDNASTDQTLKKIRTFNDQRITIHESPENIGPYRGLNELLKRARGEFIAIQDHDDLWLPTKLEQQVNYLSTHSDFIACGTLTYYFYEDQQFVVLPSKPEVTDFVDHTSLLFCRREVWYDQTRSLPDEFFERITLRQLGKIGCLQSGLTVHRIRYDHQNLSTRRTRWNVRGAWEHWRLTGYRDVAGTIPFFFYSLLPKAFQWWIRKNVTLRQATWISAKDFTAQYHLSLL